MDIVSTISKKVQLYNHGGLMVGQCPFHREKTPSLVVNPEKGTFTCLCCGAAGDMFDFIARYSNMPIEEVKTRFGVLSAAKKQPFNKRLSNVIDSAAQYYEWRMTTPYGKKGLDYFKNRGLTDETIKKFNLGVANDFGSYLIEHLKKLGYTETEIEKAGLILRKDDGSIYDRFWNRVMFPLKDEDGNFLGFTGRTLQETADKMKYCNSPETEIFRKHDIVYGLDLARNSSRDSFVIVEGNMDVISMHQAGFDNAVASCGTALTKDQCLRMRKYKKKAIILYDTDTAGITATKRAIRLLTENGFEVTCSDSLPYKDPDEFLRNSSREIMEMKLENSESYHDWLVRNGTPEEAMEILLLNTDPERYEELIGS